MLIDITEEAAARIDQLYTIAHSIDRRTKHLVVDLKKLQKLKYYAQRVLELPIMQAIKEEE